MILVGLLCSVLAWLQPAASPEPAPAVLEPVALQIQTAEAFEPRPDDVVALAGFPAIGKWMLDRHLRPASWLGTLYRGKTLREPINVLFLDPFAGSASEAVVRLMRTCGEAGYRVREGHSGGYRAYIGGALFAQIPAGKGKAFANHPFELHNNHGRIFGPVRVQDGWLFIGAVSREKLVPFTKAEHQFMSFAQAREQFSKRVDLATAYKITGLVDLGNALVGDPALTTADHDGKAVLLKAQR